MSTHTISTPCTHPGCGLAAQGQINRQTGQLVCPIGHPVGNPIVTVGDLKDFLLGLNPGANLNGMTMGMVRMCDSCRSPLAKGAAFHECQDCGAPGFDICQKCVDNPPQELVQGALQHNVMHRTIKRIHGQDGH